MYVLCYIYLRYHVNITDIFIWHFLFLYRNSKWMICIQMLPIFLCLTDRFEMNWIELNWNAVLHVHKTGNFFKIAKDYIWPTNYKISWGGGGQVFTSNINCNWVTIACVACMYMNIELVWEEPQRWKMIMAWISFNLFCYPMRDAISAWRSCFLNLHVCIYSTHSFVVVDNSNLLTFCSQGETHFRIPWPRWTVRSSPVCLLFRTSSIQGN